MKMPPDYLQPLLMAIETTVLEVHDEFPKIMSKDVEGVYSKMIKYYKLRMSGKEQEDPYSSSEKSQALIDDILNTIDIREEEKLDINIINNPNALHGEHMIPSLNHLYVSAFKLLERSSVRWRKELGPKGYINYVSNFIRPDL